MIKFLLNSYNNGLYLT